MIAYDSMSDLAEQFARQKYVIIRSCLKDPELTLLYRWACRRAEVGTLHLDDTARGALSSAGDVFMDGLLLDMLPQAEEITRLKLFPTYSYFRVYRQGDALAKHTDRESCEISMSLSLGYQGEQSWPLMIEGPQGVSSADLAPGDALLYRGIDCPHWRDSFDGQNNAQVFLHYVDQEGPYADFKYDQRPGLAFERPGKLR